MKTRNIKPPAELAAPPVSAAFSAWPSLDIEGNVTGRNLRCERCGWQTQYKTGRRKAALRAHKCPPSDPDQRPGAKTQG